MKSARNVCVLSIASLLLGSLLYAGSGPGATAPNRSTTLTKYTSSAWLDVNRVKLHLNNRGGLAFDAYGSGYWPAENSADLILFDMGPCIIGKLDNTAEMGLAQWGTSYSPGPIRNGRAALDSYPGDSLLYRVFKITRGDNAETNPDYAEWPSSLGAPLDPSGHPQLFGDQTLWTQFNNLDTTALPLGWATAQLWPRLPVEIQQAVYAHVVNGLDTSALLANVAFIEWTIINKGNVTIDSAYVSLWADIDFSDDLFNPPGVDTAHQVGYCWQGSDVPGMVPRAVGFVWLYGPTVASTGGMAIVRGNSVSDARNLPMTSFWGILDDGFPDSSFLGAPRSVGTMWNVARGFDKTGQQIVDSVTHQITRFPYSGDPVTGSGWLAPNMTGGGAGIQMFSGPFTMAPNDTQWVMAALVPVSGPDRRGCVTTLREEAATLRSMPYGSLGRVTDVKQAQREMPADFRLEQNYPNPFNPTTVVSGQWPVTSDVRLAVYDLLGREVELLADGRYPAGRHSFSFDARGLASGVYFCRLTAGGWTATRAMILAR